MSGLEHENIVQLVGFCKSPLSLVMEFLPDGDLTTFLRKRKRNDIDWITKVSIALDIAQGTPLPKLFNMRYLFLNFI